MYYYIKLIAVGSTIIYLHSKTIYMQVAVKDLNAQAVKNALGFV